MLMSSSERCDTSREQGVVSKSVVDSNGNGSEISTWAFLNSRL